jgi:hypothetical protein
MQLDTLRDLFEHEVPLQRGDAAVDALPRMAEGSTNEKLRHSRITWRTRGNTSVGWRKSALTSTSLRLPNAGACAG